MIQSKIVIILLISSLMFSIIPIVNSDVVSVSKPEIILVNSKINLNDYNIISDVKYSEYPKIITDTGFIFHMPFIVKKDQVIKENDLSGYSKNFSKDIPNVIYNYQIIEETKDYYLINYIIKTGFFIGRFDFIPQIKGYDYKEYAWFNSSFGFKKQLIIDKDQIPSNLVNFPVLVNLTDTDLRDNAVASGLDIVFVNSAENLMFEREIELYTIGTGALVAWVNVTSISSSVDTVFYMYFGSSVYTVANSEDTWDSDYAMVQHLNETSGTQYDSTINNINSVAEDITTQGSASGIADGSDDFELSNADFLKMTGLNSFDAFTIEYWMKWESETAGSVMSSNFEFSFYVFNTGAIHWNVGTGVAWGNSVTAPENTITTGNWFYVVGTGDGTNIELFHNTVSDGTIGSTNNLENTDYFDIGSRWKSTTNQHLYPFDGIIDEVRISKITRSNDWLVATYNTINNASVDCANPFLSLGGLLTNIAPVISGLSLANGSINQTIANFTWCCDLNDDYSNMNWSIESSTGDSNSSTGSSNDTYCLTVTNLSCDGNYTIYVNVSEDTNSPLITNETFWFTTVACDGVNVLPNATTFSIINNSNNNDICNNNFSVYIYDDNGNYITWSIKNNDGFSNTGTNLNGTIYLNLSDCFLLGHNYTIWINVTDDNISYNRYYIEFRTEECCFELGDNMEISILGSQLSIFLTLVLFMFFFYTGYIQEKNTGGFLMFVSGFMFLALEILIHSYLNNILIVPLLTFIGLFIIIMGLLKWLYYDEEAQKNVFKKKEK